MEDSTEIKIKELKMSLEKPTTIKIFILNFKFISIMCFFFLLVFKNDFLFFFYIIIFLFIFSFYDCLHDFTFMYFF